MRGATSILVFVSFDDVLAERNQHHQVIGSIKYHQRSSAPLWSRCILPLVGKLPTPSCGELAFDSRTSMSGYRCTTTWRSRLHWGLERSLASHKVQLHVSGLGNHGHHGTRGLSLFRMFCALMLACTILPVGYLISNVKKRSWTGSHSRKPVV